METQEPSATPAVVPRHLSVPEQTHAYEEEVEEECFRLFLDKEAKGVDGWVFLFRFYGFAELRA